MFPILKRALWHTAQISEDVYQHFRFRRNHNRRILFIVGCQRSGTTLMTKLLSSSSRTKVYTEFSPLIVNPRKRLESPEKLKQILNSACAPVVVLKPLIETQRIAEYLSYFSTASALWMYRHPKDVTLSYLEKFGAKNGINDFQALESTDESHWMCENISDHTRSLVLHYISKAMTQQDATALGWWLRNKFLFDLALDNHPQVMLCNYDEFIFNPLPTLTRIYDSLDLPTPLPWTTWRVKSKSFRRGCNIVLSKDIDQLCCDLWQALKSADGNV